MKNPNQMSRTAILVEGALMVALSFVLSFIIIFRMPLGGSITLFSTLPLILYSMRHPIHWGLGACALYGLLQALQGLDYVLFPKTVIGIILCFLLDYFIAYLCIGFTGPIARKFKNATLGLIVAIIATGLMRFVCSFFSGLLIWGAPDHWGGGVALWSLIYNGSWCAPEVGIVLAAALLLSRVKALHILPYTKHPAA